ncbi:LuxR C-terminal-related transcriptional regulator [Evansella sp. AB-P1]|uniref:response regulator transcription factor n=1 Tax=Evansella sp. AB-P1 TaxID=3037653 RepID=UPI00241EE4C4|nr:LuxR C-terminal-related transcriptional regulator [Evansella sp. AB-P1]MDG5787262.1 LuxR C-terminal-related transcriptional regulator [Evansella sp. AB-P1]
MIITTTEKKNATKFKLIYIDQKNAFASRTKDEISSELKNFYLKNDNGITGDDWIFYVVGGNDSKTIEDIQMQLNSVVDKHTKILLVTIDPLRKDMLQFLNYPINGIVSLSYFQKNVTIVLNSLITKGIFLEPKLHLELIHEIERKNNKDKPLKKLILNKRKVESILSEKEQAILQLILDGNNNAKIAEKLYFAQSTVSTTIGNILKKIQAKDRTDAMVKAIRNGWVDGYR